jgi:hypothetical protein
MVATYYFFIFREENENQNLLCLLFYFLSNFSFEQTGNNFHL